MARALSDDMALKFTFQREVKLKLSRQSHWTWQQGYRVFTLLQLSVARPRESRIKFQLTG